MVKSFTKELISLEKIFDFLSAAKICDCLNERKYILIYSLARPYSNDLDILRTIKKDDELKKIPIVVLSTLSDTKIAQLCQEIGCYAFFTKPLQKDSFLQLIATFGAETGDPKSL